MIRLISVFGGDLVAASRSLRRRPVIAGLLIVSLAIGMSVATAAFGRILPNLTTPAFADSRHVVQVFAIDQRRAQESRALAARHFLALESSWGPWTAIAAARVSREVVLGASGSATSVRSLSVTPNFFAVTGVRMTLGRTFEESDAVAGAAPVAVVSHAIWSSRLGASADPAQLMLTLNGERVPVIGVLPPGFTYPFAADVWLPVGRDQIRMTAAAFQTDFPRLLVIGRVRGANLPAATGWSQSAISRADRDVGIRETPKLRLRTVADAEIRDAFELSTVWIAAAVIVLLLCATNFATSFLGVVMARRRELATRAALGASTGRLVSTLVAEAALMGAMAGVGSIVLSFLLHRLKDGDGPGTLSGAVAVFGVVGTMVVGMVFSLAPTLQVCRADLRDYLADTPVPAKATLLRNRSALVVLQIALATLCVSSVIALVSADHRLGNFGPGYNYHSVVTARLTLSGWANSSLAEGSLLEFVRGIPGVETAALVRSPSGERGVIGLSSELYPSGTGIPWVDVSSGYFATLGVAPLSGRLPSAEEIASRAPIAVLTERAARVVGPDPIGKRVRLKPHNANPMWLTVVGVVPDIRRGPDFPFWDIPVITSLSLPADTHAVRLVIRVKGDVAVFLASLRRSLERLDVPIIVGDLRTVASEVEAFHANKLRQNAFLGALALVSLVLGCIGSYGLSSYLAESRSKEISIRVALGASMGSISRTLFGGVLAMGIAGSVIGLFAATRAAQILDAVLFGARGGYLQWIRFPVASAIGGAALLLLACVVGALIPLRIVARQNLARSLRS